MARKFVFQRTYCELILGRASYIDVYFDQNEYKKFLILQDLTHDDLTLLIKGQLNFSIFHFQAFITVLLGKNLGFG